MWVILDRDGGDLARTHRLGAVRFEQQVRREITRRGGQRPCLRIVRKLFTALAGRPACSRTDAARWSGSSCY